MGLLMKNAATLKPSYFFDLPSPQGCAFSSIETPWRLFIHTSEALHYNPTTSRRGSVPASSSITASTADAFALYNTHSQR